MKNKELIEKIINIIDEIAEDTDKIPKDAIKIYQTLCKMITIKIIEKLGKEDL